MPACLPPCLHRIPEPADRRTVAAVVDHAGGDLPWSLARCHHRVAASHRKDITRGTPRGEREIERVEEAPIVRGFKQGRRAGDQKALCFRAPAAGLTLQMAMRHDNLPPPHPQMTLRLSGLECVSASPIRNCHLPTIKFLKDADYDTWRGLRRLFVSVMAWSPSQMRFINLSQVSCFRVCSIWRAGL